MESTDVFGKNKKERFRENCKSRGICSAESLSASVIIGSILKQHISKAARTKLCTLVVKERSAVVKQAGCCRDLLSGCFLLSTT